MPSATLQPETLVRGRRAATDPFALMPRGHASLFATPLVGLIVGRVDPRELFELLTVFMLLAIPLVLLLREPEHRTESAPATE